MEVNLDRYAETDNSTASKFTIKGGNGECLFACFCLEDGFRDPKVPGETRIPAGRYRLALRDYGRFFREYSAEYGEKHFIIELCGVPNFTAILIHRGNTVLDTAGCLIIGEQITFNKATGNYELLYSKKAYKPVHDLIVSELLAENEVWITVSESLLCNKAV